MNASDDQRFGVRIDVRVRQADLGRDGSASTMGMARRLEDARSRLRLRRFERLVGTGGLGPFQVLLVGQGVDRLAPGGYEIGLAVRSADAESVRYELSVFRDSTCLGVADAVGLRGTLTAEALEAARVAA
ncbi:hypothetical protein [Streptomyces varsoviensis]|uniref:Uncharacterized protein n=1 Tax=Streptomyces varsoviensis TaxID=67373 RepID=A0ABR5J8C1_9ACTN|nr:hypothetical protein [Streptomyces varsoviensis]KOG89617.1 hypothetical protein ADK38_13265 [Streptomyces varsoviensis]